MTRAFVPTIERQTPAAIVNVLTLVALASMPGLGVYNASKTAAWSLTQSLRADLRSRNIAVHAAFPAGIDTDMLAGIDAPKAVPVDVVRQILDAVERGDEDVFPDPISQQTTLLGVTTTRPSKGSSRPDYGRPLRSARRHRIDDRVTQTLFGHLAPLVIER